MSNGGGKNTAKMFFSYLCTPYQANSIADTNYAFE